MRLFKVITLLSIVTLAALVYVHQQVELVKVSYLIDAGEKKLKDILDHKENLGYNIENLESPSRLEKILVSKKIDVAFPKRNQVILAKTAGVNIRREAYLKTAGVERKVNILGIFDFFSPRAEAQAKEK